QRPARLDLRSARKTPVLRRRAKAPGPRGDDQAGQWVRCRDMVRNRRPGLSPRGNAHAADAAVVPVHLDARGEALAGAGGGGGVSPFVRASALISKHNYKLTSVEPAQRDIGNFQLAIGFL